MSELAKLLKQTRILRFFMGGGFLVTISFINNYLFIQYLGWPVRIAYLLTMLIDFLIGFSINRFFVFKRESYQKNASKMFMQFVVWGLAFRAANWLIYVCLVEKFNLPTIIAQGTAVITLLGIKFITYHRVFK